MLYLNKLRGFASMVLFAATIHGGAAHAGYSVTEMINFSASDKHFDTIVSCGNPNNPAIRIEKLSATATPVNSSFTTPVMAVAQTNQIEYSGSEVILKGVLGILGLNGSVYNGSGFTGSLEIRVFCDGAPPRN